LTVFPNAYYCLIEGNPYCELALSNLKVDYHIKLLGDDTKNVYFYTRQENPTCTGSSIYREKTPYYSDNQIKLLKLKTSKLDDIYFDNIFDLIKIDVQGSELNILKGGKNTINTAQGVIIEIPYIEYNLKAPVKYEIINFMRELNFFPVEKLGDTFHPIVRNLIQSDILFIKKEI
jgi:FkbM family methyltransferase